MQAPGPALNDLASLVEKLGVCLAFADREQDHVLAAHINAAREVAIARLAQAAIGG